MDIADLGLLITPVYLAWCTLFAIAPRAMKPFGSLSLYFGIIGEVPFLAIFVILISLSPAISHGEVNWPIGWISFGITGLTVACLLRLIYRSTQTSAVLLKALEKGLGHGWKSRLQPKTIVQLNKKFHLFGVLGPFYIRRLSIKHITNISYGENGKYNLLDIYRSRKPVAKSPVLIHFHGGAFKGGRKNREALPMLYHMASKGWVCISANYRLQPSADSTDMLIDAKKVVAWVRTHGSDYGVDQSAVFVSGGSAGAQLAAMSAVTANESAFQPGFENVDTSVAGAITLFGYYGWTMPSASSNTPPFFVIHGADDTLLPPEGARKFVSELQQYSPKAVVYAELPGAQHNFDMFHSIRSESVIAGIEAFTEWVQFERSSNKKSRDHPTGQSIHCLRLYHIEV